MPTVTQIVTQIAPISEVLASNDISAGALFGAPLNPMWAIQIYVETQTCLWRYEQENIATGGTPSARMIANSNYLFSIICGKYGQRALSLLNSGGVIPGTSSTITYGIPTTSYYTAITDGETVLALKKVDGSALPTGSLIIYVVKGVTPLNPNQYSFVYPSLTLLSGISMSADEVLSFMYVVPT